MNTEIGNANQFVVMAFLLCRNNVMIIIYIIMMDVINNVKLNQDLYVIQNVN